MTYQGFNPLLIGETIPTFVRKGNIIVANVSFNPLLIGETIPTLSLSVSTTPAAKFQSPSHRGDHSNEKWRQRRQVRWSCFNPLLIGETIPTRNSDCSSPIYVKFQSPSHRGDHSNLFHVPMARRRTPKFQSPSHRGDHSNFEGYRGERYRC